MRTFTLHRETDTTGVSGTGIVLEGIEFTDGRIVVRWCGVGNPSRSTVVYDSFEDFLSIHVTSHPENGSVIAFSDGQEIRSSSR